MNCPNCHSDDTRPYDYKPPRRHPDNRIACDPECTKTGLFCRNCRMLSPIPATSKEG